MDKEHWFDVANKSVFRATTRREIARSVAMFLPGLLLCGATNAAAAKKRGKSKGKGNKKGKPKPKPKPAGSCSRGACNLHFVLDDNRDYCEFICRQCDGDDPREFCIVEGGPFKVAVCCVAGSKCCGGECRTPWFPEMICCDGRLVDTENDNENCGSCGNRCEAGQVCRGGSCGCEDDGFCDCGDRCQSGETCCPGLDRYECVDLMSNRAHCGSCRNLCLQECVDGQCQPCLRGEKPCLPPTPDPYIPYMCVPDNYDCCPFGGACPPYSPCCTATDPSTGEIHPYCGDQHGCWY